MDNKHLKLNANLIVSALQKPSAEFTKADIIDYIVKNDIRMVNFMYPGGDGKLKTLNFVINDLDYLETILTCGERVDGSSLFSFIQAGSSDLYVLPRFRTAFVDPFAEIPTVSMLCSYFDKDGRPLESSPEYTLHKAAEAFREVTGMEYQAMGELEYYVISDDEGVFPAQDQRGYHESAPYAKANEFRTQCMQYIAQAGGQIKYGHSEVGNFTIDGKNYDLRPEDHHGQGRLGSAHPHADDEGRPQPDARRRCALRGSPQDDCRHDGPRAVDHRLRQ